MYAQIDNGFFRKTMPRWVKGTFAFAILGFLALPTEMVAPNVFPRFILMTMFSLGVASFGISTAGLMLHGVSFGALPIPFYVSKGDTPIRFWLTVTVMLCFALALICIGLLGAIGFVADVSSVGPM